MPSEGELAQFVYEHSQVFPLDVEAGRRIVLTYLSVRDSKETTDFDSLYRAVRRELMPEPGPIPPGLDSLKPDLNEVRAELITREALQSLHAMGSVVSFGSIPSDGRSDPWTFSISHPRGSSGIPNAKIERPSAYTAYRLAIAFQDKHTRLAHADIYLASIDQQGLPSRVRRCLVEAVNAFRHGLYLSVVMNLGAASEGLWLALARTVVQVHSTPKLTAEIGKPNPQPSQIIDLTWDTLRSHLKDVMDDAVTPSDQPRLKERAHLLRDLRNYAMHSEDAGEDEPRFTYDEAGLLLLEATEYFNRIIRLRRSLEMGLA